jgi:1-deoxy-D-xylulose-5-phosphate synthase
MLSIGHPGNDAIAAAEELDKKGISAAVYDMRFVKPLDYKLLDSIAAAGFRKIITIEDGMKAGGFGEAVAEYLCEKHPEHSGKITILAVDDKFVPHGPVAKLKADCHIDAQAIIAAAL